MSFLRKAKEDYPRALEALASLRAVPPRNERMAERARAQFVAQVQALGTTGYLGRPYDGATPPSPTGGRARRLLGYAVPAFLLLTALGVSFWISAYVAQSALPGDLFYPVKIAIERGQEITSPTTSAAIQLHLRFAQRRVDEILALSQEGHYQDIPTAVANYEEQVRRAVESFTAEAADGDPAQVAEVGAVLERTFVAHEEVLAAVLTATSGEPKSALEHALVVSADSREAVLLAVREHPSAKPDEGSPTATPSATTGPTPENTPVRSNSPAPQETPVAVSDPMPTASHGPGDVPLGPPEHAQDGKPTDVPLGPPEHAQDDKPKDGNPNRNDSTPTDKPKDSTLGPPDHAQDDKAKATPTEESGKSQQVEATATDQGAPGKSGDTPAADVSQGKPSSNNQPPVDNDRKDKK
ncbi:MAG: DUF5667 domain-containing protein [Anaerolineae bacterium]